MKIISFSRHPLYLKSFLINSKKRNKFYVNFTTNHRLLSMAESAQGTQINTGQNPPTEVAMFLSHSPYDLYFQITLHTKPLFQIFISYVYLNCFGIFKTCKNTMTKIVRKLNSKKLKPN